MDIKDTKFCEIYNKKSEDTVHPFQKKQTVMIKKMVRQ